MKRKNSDGLAVRRVAFGSSGAVGHLDFSGIFGFVLHNPDNYIGE